MNPWFLLIAAIVVEIAATSFLKLSDGFARPLFGVIAIVGYAACLVMMSQIFRYLPVGVVYAIWSGVGILGITIIGWVAFGQTLNWTQVGFIGLILLGAIGLQLTTQAQ